MDHYTILLIEDNDDDRLLITQALQKSSVAEFEVLHNPSGFGGLQAIHDQFVDCVVVDFSLPDVDGMDVIASLKSAPGLPPPCIMLTGIGDEKVAVNAMKEGAADYLVKDVGHNFLRRLPELIIAAVAKNEAEADATISQQDKSELDEFNQSILDAVEEGIVSFDLNGIIRYANPAASRLLGYDTDNPLDGRPLTLLFDDPNDTSRNRAWQDSALLAALENGRKHRIEHDLIYKVNGDSFPASYSCAPLINAQQVYGGVLSFHDISARKETEQHLIQLASVDPLTELANRHLLLSTLTSTIGRAHRHHAQFAVLFIDLDRFKFVNDTLGHKVGDELLIEVARRLKPCIRQSDFLARLGGDEFTVILDEIAREEDAAIVSQKIIQTLREPFTINEHVIEISASVGITTYPQGGNVADSLLKNADLAMYRAKQLGKNQYQFFTEELNSMAHTRLEFEEALRNALHRQEFLIHYQPQFDLASKRIVGIEALIRWQRGENDILYPDKFLPLAEATGLIYEIGEWVVEQVSEQYRAWIKQGLITNGMSCGINVSPHQLLRPSFLQKIQRTFSTHDIEHLNFSLELPGSILSDDAEYSLKTMRELHDMGFGIIIDDFGVGSATLNHLKLLPIDGLKIDRSFVQQIGTNNIDQAIIDSIVSLSKTLDISVIAKGVETQKQADYLLAAGCQLAQGHLVCEPMDAEALATKILLHHKK